MQKITSFLWFDTQAEEAMNFYVSVFKNSEAGQVMRPPDGFGHVSPSAALWVSFTLEGQEFYAMNGGPSQQLTPAVSLFVSCETQGEIDELWGKLAADGGEPVACGWVKDKFGLSWQIVPSMLRPLIWDGEHPEKSSRAFAAMTKMVKLDIAALQRAYDGEGKPA